MKNYILFLFLVFSLYLIYPNTQNQNSIQIDQTQNPRDRKLSAAEVKQRGIDLLANQIMENIDEINLRKIARSAIYETSYGFRWKVVHLPTSRIIIVKVNKDFKLISVRNKDNSKIMIP